MFGRCAFRWAAIGLTCGAALGCGDADRAPDESGGGQAGATGDEARDEPWRGEPMGECDAIEEHFAEPSATHVAPCSDVAYPMSPPVYGNHYPSWPAYQTYDYPVPLGYLVHGMEHGAVVIFYDCPEGCADEVEEARAFIDSLPADPRCGAEVGHQVILVPTPGLGSRWAAAAWGFSLVSSCFDATYFGQFYEKHVGQAPEDLCNQGQVIQKDACGVLAE
jgi:hypothetical protein